MPSTQNRRSDYSCILKKIVEHQVRCVVLVVGERISELAQPAHCDHVSQGERNRRKDMDRTPANLAKLGE